MATKWLKSVLIGAGVWALLTTGASAVTLNVTAQGLWVTNQNYGCPTGSANCLTSTDFSLAAPSAATGTIDINAAGTLATIALEVASATFLGPAASTITFSNVSYTGTVTLMNLGGGSLFQMGAATGTVSGTAGGNPFSVSTGIFNMNCAIPGNVGQCGLTFGRAGFVNVEGHDWYHTFNVVLPEPSLILLLAAGLSGLALRSRRA